MTGPEIADLVRAQIMANRPPEASEVEVTDSGSLVATGVLDSVGVFTLVAFLEQKLGIEVADEDLGWKNFETVDAITRFVESKLNAAASGRGDNARPVT